MNGNYDGLTYKGLEMFVPELEKSISNGEISLVEVICAMCGCDGRGRNE